MTKLDTYWESNEDWYEYKGFTPVLKDDAPEEAKESFRRYQLQLEEKKNAV